MRLIPLAAAAVVLAAAFAVPAIAGEDGEIPFVHGYKVETLTTYDIDGRRVGHIDVAALPKDTRPVAWGENLIGLRALDGRVVFVCRNDLIMEDHVRRG